MSRRESYELLNYHRSTLATDWVAISGTSYPGNENGGSRAKIASITLTNLNGSATVVSGTALPGDRIEFGPIAVPANTTVNVLQHEDYLVVPSGLIVKTATANGADVKVNIVRTRIL